MASTKAKTPRPGTGKCRPTTLSLTDAHWNELLRIERETGARPSATVRLLIDTAMRKSGRTSPRPGA